MVNRWNTDGASVVVAIPFVISLAITIVWPTVAVVRYEADLNASVQTGFAVGSYVITAGAILIALVAFLDTQNEKAKDP